jgi:hypothetical protein
MDGSAIVTEDVSGAFVHAESVAMTMPEQVTRHSVLVQK